MYGKGLAYPYSLRPFRWLACLSHEAGCAVHGCIFTYLAFLICRGTRAISDQLMSWGQLEANLKAFNRKCCEKDCA